MNSSNRQAYLDWLRIIAILGVLFFHSAMPFATGENWHIRNGESSNIFLEFTFWLSRFRMPLLFFISGAVAFYMLKSKTKRAFVRLRFQRLIIPLLFGMLVIVPPQIYMERLTQGYTGNFLDFYPSVFKFKPYPAGNTSWHHLWFILYLFLYDLIALPFFGWYLSEKGKNWRMRIEGLAKGRRVFLLLLPGILGIPILMLQFPRSNDLVHDLGYFPYWFYFFFIGFILISSQALTESLKQNRRLSLLVGLVSIILINYLRWNQIEPWKGETGWLRSVYLYGYLVLLSVTAWGWLLALVGYGKKYLNRRTAFSDYANQAIYPFYILHQTVIVILAYYVVQTTDTILLKYLFIVFTTFSVSVLIYHLLIRPYPVMRFLFGMKKDSQKLAEKKASQPLATELEELAISA